MHPDLQLKRVEVMSDLPARLCQFLSHFVDKQNAVYSEADLAKVEFPELAKIERVSSQAHRHSENSVAQGVHGVTVQPCAMLASTLLFDLPSWTQVLDTSERAQNVTQSFAKADSFVFVDRQRAAAAPLSDSARADIKLLEECGLQNFLLYEFKNLEAGDLDTLNAIVSQPVAFTHKTCTGYKTCDRSTDHLVDGYLALTGHDVGPDARYTGYFNLSTIPSISQDSAQLDDDVDAGASSSAEPQGVLTQWSISDSSLPTIPEEATDGAAVLPASVHSSKFLTTTGPKEALLRKKKAKRVKGPKKGQVNTGSRKKAERSKEGTDKRADVVVKAQNITQQVWAELVNNDATFVVISAGNYEIIGMRHRATQTLYFSPVLSTAVHGSATPHRHIIVSLMVLAYCDALDRARQKKVQPVDVSGLPAPFCHSFSRLGFLNETRQVKALDINEAFVKLLRDATHMQCEIPTIYMEKPTSKELYHATECEPYKPWHPFRSVYTPPVVNKPPAMLRLTVDKTQKLKYSGRASLATQQGTRIVYYTLSRLDEHGNEVQFFTGNLIMKFSLGTETSNKALRDEYDMYKNLQGAKDSFPEVFGVYQFHGTDVCALLMACTGMSLDFWLHKSQVIQQRIIIKRRAAIKDALKRLHDSMWLHGNITPSHVIVAPHGKVTFISPRLASPVVEEEAQSQTLEPYTETLTPAKEMKSLDAWIRQFM